MKEVSFESRNNHIIRLELLLFCDAVANLKLSFLLFIFITRDEKFLFKIYSFFEVKTFEICFIIAEPCECCAFYRDFKFRLKNITNMDRVKRIWYLPLMRAAKVQASLRIRAVSPEPSLLAHTSSESRGTFRQKTRSLAPLNGWACAVEICHDGMLEDTNSLGGAHIITTYINKPHVARFWIFGNFICV